MYIRLETKQGANLKMKQNKNLTTQEVEYKKTEWNRTRTRNNHKQIHTLFNINSLPSFLTTRYIFCGDAFSSVCGLAWVPSELYRWKK